MEEDMTGQEEQPAAEVALLRALVQRRLGGQAPEQDLSPAEQELLWAWYEGELDRLQELLEAMVSLAIDDATAARYRAEATLARAGGVASLWDFRTGTPLDADEGPTT